MIKNGMNRLLLLGRNGKKLNDVKTELETLKSEQTLEIDTLEYDFERDYTENDVKELETKLEKYLPNISILFNNAGVFSCTEFTKSEFKLVKQLVGVNVYGTIFLTQIILKSMVKRKEKSLIVGIGSGSVLVSPRYLHLYVGTKAFMKPFINSLHDEYQGKIDFTYCHVGPVQTDMQDIVDLPNKIQPDAWAGHLMTKIGRDNETYVNPFNSFFHMMFRSFGLFSFVTRGVFTRKLTAAVKKSETEVLNNKK